MAHIPAERTSTGPPWWVWLLGALALVAIIWFVAELFDNEPDADELAGRDDTVGMIDDVEIEPGAGEVDGDIAIITSEDWLYADGADDPAAPVDGGRMDGVTVTRLEPGTAVDLANARVMSVVGDSAFWIGRDDARRFLVVLAGLGESETGAGGSDGVFDIDEGDAVSITGALARYADGGPGLSELTNDDTERLRQRDVYIRVSSRDDITVSG